LRHICRSSKTAGYNAWQNVVCRLADPFFSEIVVNMTKLVVVMTALEAVQKPLTCLRERGRGEGYFSVG
jgi:hypothetical protein